MLPAAYALLPPSMQSPEATAILLAIGLQESAFEYRQQIPVAHAHGFWQFEKNGGCVEVLTHPACKGHLKNVLAVLQYPATTTPGELHAAIVHNDVLAAVCARLLLRTIAAPLPMLDASPDASWQQYLQAWRPGKARRRTWDWNHGAGVVSAREAHA